MSTATESPIVNASEAERALANLNKIMDRLVETVEEETARVRAGKRKLAPRPHRARAALTRLRPPPSQAPSGPGPKGLWN